jgi:hypothetical protein
MQITGRLHARKNPFNNCHDQLSEKLSIVPPSLIEGASRRPLPRKSCPRKLSGAALTERMDRVNPAKHAE